MSKGLSMKDWAQALGHNQVKYRRVLSYGEFGSGKTRFGGTFPDPFIIDTDRGLLSLSTAGLLPPPNRVLELTKHDSVFKVTKDVILKLRNGSGPFETDPPQTLIIDSFTSLVDMLLYEAMTSPDNPLVKEKNPDYEKAEYDHWGLLRNRAQSIWEMLKDLPMHVYVTAGVKVEKSDSTGDFIGEPNLQGSSRGIIGHAFDEVYYFKPSGSGDKVKYTVYTKNCDFYHAKSRLDLPAKLESPTFDELYKNVKPDSQ